MKKSRLGRLELFERERPGLRGHRPGVERKVYDSLY